jgi:hypothetical protein
LSSFFSFLLISFILWQVNSSIGCWYLQGPQSNIDTSLKKVKKKFIENNKLVQNQKNHRPNLENAISQLKCQKIIEKTINNQIVNMMFILSMSQPHFGQV